MSLTVEIDDAVASEFSAHAIGVLRVRAVGDVNPRPGAIASLRERFLADSSATAAAVPYWREVFARMGAKPKYGPSIEKLSHLVERHGGTLPIPVELVELYCWFSLVHGVPMAGYRTEAISGGLRLTRPGAGMPFTPLGQPRGSQERTKPREVAYIDDEKAICRYWNYRDCDETKLTDGIDDVLFVFDLVDREGMVSADMAPELFGLLIDMLQDVCVVATTIVSAAIPTGTIE